MQNEEKIIVMDKKEETVDLDNARKEEQIAVMKEIIARGDDPFTWENLPKYHTKPILRKSRFWLVTENQWPYDGIRVQLLFIYKDSVSEIHQLAPGSYDELLELVQEFSEIYDIEGGMFSMRFGATKYSGATVKHLHAQLISPEEGAQCAVWVGQKPKTNN